MSGRSRRFRFGGFKGVARPMCRCQMCEVHTVAGHAIAGGRTGGVDFAIGEFLRSAGVGALARGDGRGERARRLWHGLACVGQGIVADCRQANYGGAQLDSCRRIIDRCPFEVTECGQSQRYNC